MVVTPVDASAGRAAALLDAATRRFVAVGIAKTTMEDIAREAGAGKATLYRYFPNKAAVVDALVARENARFERHLERAAEAVEGAAERVEEAFVAGLEFLRSHPVLTKSLAEEPDILLPYLTEPAGPVVRSGMRLLTELVRAGVASGELRDVEPEWAAETLFRLLLSFFTVPALVIGVDDPAELRSYARGLVAGGLARSPGRPGNPEARPGGRRAPAARERDRDERGRPANARPRDRFGRPLPRGAADEMPDRAEPGDVVSSVAEAFARGRALFDEQRFFEAHEFLEHVWKEDGEPADRDFWKGVTQVAVACCHAQRGNETGAVALLGRARDYLAPYPARHRGVDVAALRRHAADLAGEIRARGPSPDLDFPRFPAA